MGATSYLEIGLHTGKTFEAVSCPVKVGVDPFHRIATARLPSGASIIDKPSDEFFSSLGDEKKFDLVFVDGLHTFKQSYRDVVNSVAHLKPGGVVLIDDVVPSSAAAAIPSEAEARTYAETRGGKLTDWMGDVYRTALALSRFHSELQVMTVIGDGHRPQMVVQPLPGHQGLRELASSQLDEAGSAEFEDVFANGIPDFFNPCTLEEAIMRLTRVE